MSGQMLISETNSFNKGRVSSVYKRNNYEQACIYDGIVCL